MIKGILIVLMLIISSLFVYSIAYIPTNVKSGQQTGFSCDATVANAPSVKARIGDQECSRTSVSGTKYYFQCPVPTSGGFQMQCYVDNSISATNTPLGKGIFASGSICVPTTWSPDISTVCSGQSFTQTSNCETTQSATGTKTCILPIPSGAPTKYKNGRNWLIDGCYDDGGEVVCERSCDAAKAYCGGTGASYATADGAEAYGGTIYLPSQRTCTGCGKYFSSIDCSGSCSVTVTATCSDGTKNQDETGIDCGGATCAACPTDTGACSSDHSRCGGVDSGGTIYRCGVDGDGACPIKTLGNDCGTNSICQETDSDCS